MTAPSSPGGRSPLKVAGIALIGVGVLAGVVGVFGLTGFGGGGDESAAAAPPSASAAPSDDPNAVPVPPVGDDPGANGAGGAGAAPGADGAPGAGTPGTGGGPGAPGGASPFTPGAPGTPGAQGTPGGAPAAAGGAGAPGADGGAGAGGAGAGGAGATGGDRAAAEGQAAARPVVRVYNNSTIKGLAEKAAEEFRRSGWTVSAVQNYPQGVIPATTVYYRQGTAEKTAADEMARKWGMRSEARFEGIQDADPGIIVIITKDFKAT